MLDIQFPAPHHWIKFSHKDLLTNTSQKHLLTGGKYVDCYVGCRSLRVSSFFIKYFFVF